MRALALITWLGLQYLFCVASHAEALSRTKLPPTTGKTSTTMAMQDETLMEIALRERLGFENIVNSNPHHDPWKPGHGAQVTLPRESILPSGAQPGISINLAEMRLYHITNHEQQYNIDVYPLGIGRAGRDSPEGEYHIIVKEENPTWSVPLGLRTEDSSLPEFVPPGPDNPLGNYWLGLSEPGYGVHGTNRLYGVGRRVSYGCLRMYPEDIEHLFKQVRVGTRVMISYQPVKAVRDGDSLLLEVHPDYLRRLDNLYQEALSVISKTGWSGEIDYGLVNAVVSARNGIPQLIGSLEKHD